VEVVRGRADPFGRRRRGRIVECDAAVRPQKLYVLRAAAVLAELVAQVPVDELAAVTGIDDHVVVELRRRRPIVEVELPVLDLVGRPCVAPAAGSRSTELAK
jgi:hypothetical protein